MDLRSRKGQYLSTLAVSLAFVASGTGSGWTTPVLLKFKRNETDVDITMEGISWMVSMNPVGFILGSFITRFTSDRLGRRATIVLSVAPFYTGTIIAAFALKGWLLSMTTLLWSIGTGMLSTVVGVYLAEITEKDIRGTMSLFTRVGFNLGNLLVTIGGPFLSYTVLNYCLLVLPALNLATCWWIPETPCFLLKEQRVEAARKSLRILRGSKNEKTVEEELAAIQAGVKKDMCYSSSIKELFSGKQYRKAIIIAAGLKCTQIFTGGVAIRNYLGIIMEEGRWPQHLEKLMFLIYGIIVFGVGIMSSLLVDKVGRRPLLIYSYAITAAALATVGIYFYLLDVAEIDRNALSPYYIVPFAGIMVASVVSNLGFNSIVGLIPSEIFPLNVRSWAMTCLNVFGGALGFTVAKGYQGLKDVSGSAGSCVVFALFATVALSGAVFSYFFVPETKGKDLAEIQLELQGRIAPQDAAEGTEMEAIATRKEEA